MKRVLIAGVLGGLLLLGTPTLAASAEKEGRRFEKRSDHKDDGDKGDRDKGDRDKGDRRERAREGDDDRDDRDGRHRRYRHHRHHRHYHDGYYYGGYYRYRHPYYGGYYRYRDPYYDPYYPYGPGYNYPRRHGQVIVSGMRFNPPEVHSRAGDPVLWLFDEGDIPHTVTANNGSFDSGRKVNDEYQLRFHHPGTYSYHCAIHPEMTGKVIIH